MATTKAVEKRLTRIFEAGLYNYVQRSSLQAWSHIDHNWRFCYSLDRNKNCANDSGWARKCCLQWHAQGTMRISGRHCQFWGCNKASTWIQLLAWTNKDFTGFSWCCPSDNSQVDEGRSVTEKSMSDLAGFSKKFWAGTMMCGASWIQAHALIHHIWLLKGCIMLQFVRALAEVNWGFHVILMIQFKNLNGVAILDRPSVLTETTETTLHQ